MVLQAERMCVSVLALLDQRLYGTYKGVTGELGARAPDTILKNLYWQHSSCINQGIFVFSCYKVIFTLAEEIPPGFSVPALSKFTSLTFSLLLQELP